MTGDLPSHPDAIPEGVAAFRRTPLFTEAAIPAALLADHRTKTGSWGLIHVVKGRLLYAVTDPRRPPREQRLTPETPPGIVEPDILHRVAPEGEVAFFVEFWRA